MRPRIAFCSRGLDFALLEFFFLFLFLSKRACLCPGKLLTLATPFHHLYHIPVPSSGIPYKMICDSFDARHWLERSALQDQHWDRSPWPAQMVKLMDSDTEREEDDVEDNFPTSARQTLSIRKRAETYPTISSSSLKSEPQYSHSNMASSTLTLDKPPFPRGTSYRHYRCRSESSSLKGVIQKRRHHTRRDSNSEPAGEHLHIDTVLPLRLPPSNLKTISPLMAYPCPWWGDNSFENIRRSESSASFLSASSDGSWHGDHGDEDPNGQLEQALSQMSASPNKQVTKDGLVLQTYDYDQDLDEFSEPFTTHLAGKEKDLDINVVDDTEGEEIKAHAGPIMNNVASFFLDAKTLVWPSSFFSHQTHGSSSTSHNKEEVSRMDRRVLMSNLSDCALFGTISSPNQLNAESDALNSYRRQRAATLPPSRMLSPPYRHQDIDASSSKLHSLWHWFMPTIDDQLEHELFGYSRLSAHSRRDSIPSLATNSSTESDEEDEVDSDDEMAFASGRFGLDQLIMSDQDISLSTKRNLLPKQTYRKNSSLQDNTAPSPLWDNRWVEEPYQRTWSSVLGLSSM